MKLLRIAGTAIATAGFQPTYKELKQCLKRPCKVALYCFQPTYKELKLDPGGEARWEIRGFQPTYKELKHVTRSEKVFIRQVSSLPIRN